MAGMTVPMTAEVILNMTVAVTVAIATTGMDQLGLVGGIAAAEADLFRDWVSWNSEDNFASRGRVAGKQCWLADPLVK